MQSQLAAGISGRVFGFSPEEVVPGKAADRSLIGTTRLRIKKAVPFRK
jgi:hypothetical protein